MSIAAARTISIGGMTKPQLLAQLQAANVQLNDSARILFEDNRFKTSPKTFQVQIAEVSVADLGFIDGARIATIHARAIELGHLLCPLELAAHFRLQFPDQPEGFIGQPASQHRAPPGSLTIASPELTPDDNMPKGFYLRRIEGVLWLRGYRSGPEHLWSPADRFIFQFSQLPR
jgi:hypothetical protein